MVRYRRVRVPGGTYFFTVALAYRRSSLLVDRIDDLRAAFADARKRRPFEIDAIVVLPEHLHALMTLPEGDADYSARWQHIKSRFTRRVGAHEPNAKGEHTIWQRRFWEHTIRDEADFERHVDYIHINPVKHGLVTRVRDWPHSSFHRHVREGTLPLDWGGDMRDLPGRFGEPP